MLSPQVIAMKIKACGESGDRFYCKRMRTNRYCTPGWVGATHAMRNT